MTALILPERVDPYFLRKAFSGITALAMAWCPPADPTSPKSDLTTVPAAFW